MCVVSIVMPIHNAAAFLAEALDGVASQALHVGGRQVQLVAVDDASTDGSWDILQRWIESCGHCSIVVTPIKSQHASPRGVGWATNTAVAHSTGTYICLMDADDVSEPARVALQLERIQALEAEQPRGDAQVLLGCNFVRIPDDSTARYTAWLNRLSDAELMSQRFVECTIVKPSWFLRREWFLELGGFDEGGRGVPEDMIFFYKHTDRGGRLAKVHTTCLRYRHHAGAATASVKELTIFEERFKAFERQVLRRQWASSPSFTIWNAGKLGKRFFRALSREDQLRVRAFCDVDDRKIAHGEYFNKESGMETPVPVIHFSQGTPPIVLCVKLDLTNGQFEQNLASLHLREGVDYLHFC